MEKKYQIAIDGFSSCGKSTLAKALAKELRFLFVDSGAMYRAVALYCINHNVKIEDSDQLNSILLDINIQFKQEQDTLQIYLNEENVTEAIRDLKVASQVSEVAAISSVRKKLVAQQQKMAESNSLVMDGRDIGTVVFPNASIKFFITADPLIRAQRRYNELRAKGNPSIDFNLVVENLSHRDRIDSTRDDSPLRKADDAIEIDNSTLSEKEQLQVALTHLYNKFPELKN
ncbi:MAG: (d)CMP kinase [Saprospiraceae bacterium]|jgi:cytidylate kinase|nr:(d)CMP kinase [Saprospiraceae bacterium]